MPVVCLVDDLVDQVRDQTEEENTEDISNDDILQALNRAQQKLVRLASRHYQPMFQREATITSFNGRRATIPETAFGFIVDQVDVLQGETAYRVYPAPATHLTDYENNSSSLLPRHFFIQGQDILLFPNPSEGTRVRVRYQLRPPRLVLQQGRITNITNIASNEITLDAIGSSLTTSVDGLNAFVNIVDGTTGIVKKTMQVASINTTSKVVTFKSSGLERTTVFGQTVSTSLSTDDVDLDDYLTIANGTCIPTLVMDYDDFLIQHAVVAIKRRFGEPTAEDKQELLELEEDVRLMWAGRPASRKVTKKNRHWGRQVSLINVYR